MTIDDNIRAEKTRYDINRKAAYVALNAEKCCLLIKVELQNKLDLLITL